MMNVQEQEERDYSATAFRNEFQAAFALSQIERTSDSDKIETLVMMGAYVVVAHVEDFCRFTDAFLGMRKVIHAVYFSRAEAEDAHAALQPSEDQSYFYTVEPKLLGR